MRQTRKCHALGTASAMTAIKAPVAWKRGRLNLLAGSEFNSLSYTKYEIYKGLKNNIDATCDSDI